MFELAVFPKRLVVAVVLPAGCWKFVFDPKSPPVVPLLPPPNNPPVDPPGLVAEVPKSPPPPGALVVLVPKRPPPVFPVLVEVVLPKRLLPPLGFVDDPVPPNKGAWVPVFPNNDGRPCAGVFVFVVEPPPKSEVVLFGAGVFPNKEVPVFCVVPDGFATFEPKRPPVPVVFVVFVFVAPNNPPPTFVPLAPNNDGSVGCGCRGFEFVVVDPNKDELDGGWPVFWAPSPPELAGFVFEAPKFPKADIVCLFAQEYELGDLER